LPVRGYNRVNPVIAKMLADRGLLAVIAPEDGVYAL
jgi:hypothetical protein